MGMTAVYESDGCNIATLHLREQTGDDTIKSHCQVCPFEDCILGTNEGKTLLDQLTRNVEIKKLRKQGGMAVKDIASKFKLSEDMIYKILRGGKQHEDSTKR